HKVPVTIRSRCQHYSFRLIPASVIADRVSYILQAEGITADAQAIAIVAREAAGSMRDALTLLDQVIAFSGERLLGSEVALKLGLADREQLFRMAEAVLSGDAKQALEVVDSIASQGLDFGHFTRQWLDLTRDMVVLRVAGEKRELVELPELERERASSVAQAHGLLELERVFAGIAKLVDEVAKSSSPRLMLEMGAVRLATRPAMRELSELLARLAQLEASGPNNAASAAPSGPQGSPVGARPATPARPSAGNYEQGTRGSDPGVQAGGNARNMGPAKDASAKPNPFQRFVPPESSAREVQAQSGAMAPMAPMAAVTQIGSARAVALQAVEAPVGIRSAGIADTAPPKLQPAPPMRSQIPELWLSVIAELRAREPRWAAMFEHGIPQELSRERVVVAFQEGSFFGRQASSQGGVDALRLAAQSALHAQPEVVVRFASEVRGQTVAQRDAAQLDERKEGIKKKALNHPRVLEALKVFPELAMKQDIQID
ncbi:MAG: polymerase subunit gamma and tau, partial [Myxococcaceae bacterium]|nr:polymerase subunit gamma and tau [Myxococcaceae bacterium]